MVSGKIFILFVCLLFAVVFGKECFPTTLKDLDYYCRIISGAVLTIEDVEDKADLKTKLQSVDTITAGVKVIGTDWEVFDLLDSVNNISNPNGPALVFARNKNLKRIKLNALVGLQGQEHAVEFDNDNFPSAAYESSEALSDLLAMEYAYRGDNKAVEQCSTIFMKVIQPEIVGSDILTIIFAAVAAVFAVLDIIFAVFIFSQQGKKKAVKIKSKRSTARDEQKEKMKEANGNEIPKDK